MSEQERFSVAAAAILLTFSLRNVSGTVLNSTTQQLGIPSPTTGDNSLADDHGFCIEVCVKLVLEGASRGRILVFLVKSLKRLGIGGSYGKRGLAFRRLKATQ